MNEQTNQPELKDIKPQLIKLVLELGPLILFFFVNAKTDIFTATAVFMVAMIISLTLSWIILKKVAVMPLVAGAVVLIFGGLTLYLQDDTFIKMKPTIVNILFGGILLGGLFFGHSLLKHVFGDVYKLKEGGWSILTLRWGIFFIFLAIVNEIVWRGSAVYFADPKEATDFWVMFKVWGIMPITIVFSMFQMPLLTKYAAEETD